METSHIIIGLVIVLILVYVYYNQMEKFTLRTSSGNVQSSGNAYNANAPYANSATANSGWLAGVPTKTAASIAAAAANKANIAQQQRNYINQQNCMIAARAQSMSSDQIASMCQ